MGSSGGGRCVPVRGTGNRGAVRRARALAVLIRGPVRWGVVIVALDPTVGHEQQGTRRALVVSYEPFHRSGLATICPITTRPVRYPGEVAIPAGHAGQTKDGVILIHQLRTIDLRRVTAFEVGGVAQHVTDPVIRRSVRAALAHQLGLDLPADES